MSSSLTHRLTRFTLFAGTKALTFLNALMRCLSWRFDAWSGDFVDLFFRHIGNDFAEIRNLLADVRLALACASAMSAGPVADLLQQAEPASAREGSGAYSSLNGR